MSVGYLITPSFEYWYPHIKIQMSSTGSKGSIVNCQWYETLVGTD